MKHYYLSKSRISTINTVEEIANHSTWVPIAVVLEDKETKSHTRWLSDMVELFGMLPRPKDNTETSAT